MSAVFGDWDELRAQPFDLLGVTFEDGWRTFLSGRYGDDLLRDISETITGAMASDICCLRIDSPHIDFGHEGQRLAEGFDPLLFRIVLNLGPDEFEGPTWTFSVGELLRGFSDYWGVGSSEGYWLPENPTKDDVKNALIHQQEIRRFTLSLIGNLRAIADELEREVTLEGELSKV